MTTQDGKSCTGKYICEYDNNAPVFVCEKCGDRETTWQKFYNEYLELFRTKDNWDIEKHKITCILGFFCHMYGEFYKTPYIFVPQNPNPYSSKECRDAHKLLAAFDGDAHRVRKYMYWLFKKTLRPSMEVTSFNYLNAPGLVRKYKLQVQKQNTLSRSSQLPTEFIKWCENNTQIFNNYELSTMNDLGALLKHYNTYINDPESVEAVVLNEAERRKLILNNKLNIGG